MKKFITLQAVLLIVAVACAQILVDQDHDHHEEESSFNHLAEITGSASEDFIDVPAITNLLEMLKTRVECEAGQTCSTCLKYETVSSLLNIGSNVTQFTEESFAAPAALIMTMLANDTCTGINTNALVGSTLCGPDVITTIRATSPRYHRNENNTQLQVGQTYSTGGSVTPIEPATDTGHDGHNHRRKRETDEHDHEKRCYTRDQLKNIYGYTTNMTRSEMLSVSPSLLQQVASASCLVNATDNTTTPAATSSNYTQAQKFGYGTAAVVVISMLAFVGILTFPTLNSPVFKMITQFFVALGVGTLSGDAILHIIPEVLGIHAHTPGEDHTDDYTYLYKLVVVIAGLYLLYLFENIIKVVRLQRLQKERGPDFDMEATSNKHGHSHNIHQLNSSTSDQANQTDTASYDTESMIESKPIFCGINSVSLMILLGDSFHNFGDGIAIGAAFGVNWVTGIGTSLAIFCHELPHEFADFAIYINNGLPKWKALFLNFFSACWCFVGLYIGLVLSDDTAVRQWLLAVVAGMFLYVSLVDILHEMTEVRSNKPVIMFCIQNFGMILGWVILFLIALYEEQLVNSINPSS
uniref:zinc transporter ZIP12 isoform X2 n=1 Tax=Ciona intestinalis TaxID=7719 RepID=UPI000EF53EB1|nr:zinc transporter ZIP12 isoform X2 [Ciona intestinalis]|eukprot:XP_026696580.1 zinc transporter ZIP12 isoform X2 [Ciona intestinalis]